MTRPFWSIRFVLLLLAFAATPAFAQDLSRQPTAFTAWVDFAKLSTRELPIWIERIDKQTVKSDPTVPERTIYRLRFRRFTGLVDQILLRVYFDDQPGARPVVAAWSEIGAQLQRQTLGQGLGLPSSETVTINMNGVDYVDIQAPGDGTTVRGILAMALRKAQTAETVDFGGTAPVADPFGNGTPAITGTQDLELFGRVKATLEPGVVGLGTTDNPAQGAVFDFQLDRPPLLALLTFEVLNADIAAPPQLTVNGTAAGPVSISVPDLADPALTGAIQPARPDAVYRYAGWLKCQKVVPGSLLTAGTNEIFISTPPGTQTPVALRSIEVQLKYSTTDSP